MEAFFRKRNMDSDLRWYQEHNNWSEIIRFLVGYIYGTEIRRWPKWLEGFIYNLARNLSIYYRKNQPPDWGDEATEEMKKEEEARLTAIFLAQNEITLRWKDLP